MYKPPKGGKKGDSYCKECLVNSEKAGHREDGKSKSKKTMTYMSLSNGQCCPFKVVVKWDNKEFYIDTKCSVSVHKFHLMVSADCMHIPTRLIPVEKRENLIALADACVGSGIGRNFLYSKLGKYISNAKIAYIQNLSPN
jgi:hypothetical protein